jgi:hypothetical protein
MNQVRRVASGGGLRLVIESVDGGQKVANLSESDVNTTLAAVLANHAGLAEQPDARSFLKCGRFLIEAR